MSLSDRERAEGFQRLMTSAVGFIRLLSKRERTETTTQLTRETRQYESSADGDLSAGKTGIEAATQNDTSVSMSSAASSRPSSATDSVS